jgi:hypothetical protein
MSKNLNVDRFRVDTKGRYCRRPPSSRPPLWDYRSGSLHTRRRLPSGDYLRGAPLR